MWRPARRVRTYPDIHRRYRPESGCVRHEFQRAALEITPTSCGDVICEVIEQMRRRCGTPSGTEARRTRRLRLDRRIRRAADRPTNTNAPKFPRCDLEDHDRYRSAVFCLRIVDGEAHAAPAVGPSAGMGCHTSPAVALARALTEAAYSCLTWIASSRDDVPRIDHEVFRSPDVLSAVRAEQLEYATTVEDEVDHRFRIERLRRGCALVDRRPDRGWNPGDRRRRSHDADPPHTVGRVIVPGWSAP